MFAPNEEPATCSGLCPAQRCAMLADWTAFFQFFFSRIRMSDENRYFYFICDERKLRRSLYYNTTHFLYRDKFPNARDITRKREREASLHFVSGSAFRRVGKVRQARLMERLFFLSPGKYLTPKEVSPGDFVFPLAILCA